MLSYCIKACILQLDLNGITQYINKNIITSKLGVNGGYSITLTAGGGDHDKNNLNVLELIVPIHG